ncbi:ATP-binding protein [Streptomyces coffeae]|uniref:AAA family ATPase n=1 Tax=Streptomyces coffeae TaxID=621382 RepID=A0ABS1NCZ7_9ACTN|nr:LuxR C-terminal-related transcriptional regulator [Streptomyces coffeae]MBL1097928.1 AAA family ATPase [Streptomyces coffeae]
MGAAVRDASTLPAEMNSFVGRRREVSQVRHLLSSGRLVTLTGAGGIGKTRLAVRVAADVHRSFPGGVWLVELATLEEETLVAQAVAAKLRLGNESGREPVEMLADYLVDQRLLLILDNCEHLLEQCASLVATLLGAARDLHVLATSRQALGVHGERPLPVPPMSLPEPGEVYASEAPGQCEAVRLFTDRAVAVRHDFVVTADKAQAIAQICRRLDGMPLAIELAAARTRVLSVEEILHRLDDRFHLLTGGSRSALPRHRTLRAAIDWSFELCSTREQQLWSRLSVFSDGFDLPSVEAVCCGDGIERSEVLDLVTDLVDKSVLGCEEHGARMRYWLPETLRQYGLERLAASGEKDTLRARHRDYYHGLADQAEAEWFGPGQFERFRVLRAEHPNLRAALAFCMSDPGQARSGLALAAAMWSHRLGFGSLGEGRRWLSEGLTLDAEPSPVTAKALYVDGLLALLQGDGDGAAARLEQFRSLPQELRSHPDLARAAVTIEGLSALFRGHFRDAVPALEDAFSRHMAAGDPGSAAVTAFMLTTAFFNLDDARAAEHAERCLALCETHQAEWSRTHARWALALEEYRQGSTRRAATLVRHALREKPLSHDQYGIAQCLEVLGWCAMKEGRGARAATLLGAAQATWEVSGSALSGFGHLLTGHQRCEAALRQEMGDEAFTLAFHGGRQLTLEQAVTYALEEKQAAAVPPPAEAASAPLTPRERQVADLVAQGLSNKEIAAKLVIARRTAEGHVEHILTKLGFTSRSQIAAWATRQEAG